MSDSDDDLCDKIIKHDQSLTPEERKVERAQKRGDMYLEQLHRQLKMLSNNMPPLILAANAYHNYQVACSLWPEEMAREIKGSFIGEIRRRSARCQMCGDDLPMPYGESEYCPKCNAECDRLDQEYGGEA